VYSPKSFPTVGHQLASFYPTVGSGLENFDRRTTDGDNASGKLGWSDTRWNSNCRGGRWPTPRYSSLTIDRLRTFCNLGISINIRPSRFRPLSVYVLYLFFNQIWKFQSLQSKNRQVGIRKNSKISRRHGSRISVLKQLNLFYRVTGVGFDFGQSAHSRFRLQIIRRTRNPEKPRPSVKSHLPVIDRPVRS